MKDFLILAINPGSTSDEIALFRGNSKIFHKTVRYSPNDLSQFDGKKVTEQFDFRKSVSIKALAEHGISVESLDAVVGRGGLLKPIPSGTYLVNDAMLADLKLGVMGDHPSNLGGIIAHSIASVIGKPAFIADPVVVDEMEPLARYSGMPENPRISIFHALNQKRVARKTAEKIGRKYEDCIFIVAHAGGGSSVGLHRHGKVVDVNNALDGDGPLTPQRSGGVPSGGLARLCFSGKYTVDEIKLKIKGRGGALAYSGTSDMVLIEKVADGLELSAEQRAQLKPGFGQQEAQELLQAIVYQVAKEIGGLAAASCGKVDGIILTGGLAFGKKHYVEPLRERVEWIAPVHVFPGGEEMSALYEATLRVLTGESTALTYA